MERRTFSLMFFIRRTKLGKNLEAPVMLRVTVNGERTDFSIQRTILPEHWNSERGCAIAMSPLHYQPGLNKLDFGFLLV